MDIIQQLNEDLKKFRILYVEDTKYDQMILRRLLEKKCEIASELVTVETGTEGLKKLEEEEFDLLILDYRLPGMTGLDFLKELEKKHFKTPIIFVTSKGDEKVAVEAMKHGVRDYIVKDEIDLDRLVKNIREIVVESSLPEEVNSETAMFIAKLFSSSPTINLENIEPKQEGTFTVEELVSTLNKLVEANFLEAEPIHSAVSCPICKSLWPKLHLQCPECKSAQLSKGEALEHMGCGGVDFRFKFDKGNGEVVCPKCGKKVRQIGVDYRKVGTLYRCANDHFFSLPVFNFECFKCDKEFDLDQAMLEMLFQYKLTEKGHSRLKLGLLKADMVDMDKKSESDVPITVKAKS